MVYYYDLEIIKRDDVKIPLTFTHKDTGLPYDLTGYSFFFTVKINKTDPDTSAVISEDFSPSSPPTDGIAVLTLDDTQTDVDAQVYYYDVQIVDGSGDVTTIMLGEFTVVQDITVRTS